MPSTLVACPLAASRLDMPLVIVQSSTCIQRIVCRYKSEIQNLHAYNYVDGIGRISKTYPSALFSLSIPNPSIKWC